MSSCSNCNIQNSNPSIGEIGTKTRRDRTNKVDVTKRYNPAALLNSNLNTNTTTAVAKALGNACGFGKEIVSLEAGSKIGEKTMQSKVGAVECP